MNFNKIRHYYTYFYSKESQQKNAKYKEGNIHRQSRAEYSEGKNDGRAIEKRAWFAGIESVFRKSLKKNWGKAHSYSLKMSRLLWGTRNFIIVLRGKKHHRPTWTGWKVRRPSEDCLPPEPPGQQTIVFPRGKARKIPYHWGYFHPRDQWQAPRWQESRLLALDFAAHPPRCGFERTLPGYPRRPGNCCTDESVVVTTSRDLYFANKYNKRNFFFFLSEKIGNFFLKFSFENFFIFFIF